MVNRTLTFLIGILLFQQQEALPAARWLIVLLPLLVVPRILPERWRAPAWLGVAVMAGFIWAWGHAAMVLQRQLPAELEGADLLVEGFVASIPENDGQRSRFLFDTTAMSFGDETKTAPGRIRLAWYRPYPTLVAGQHWRFQVRLKRPHGMANPATFDYEGWLYQQGIRATGYVRASGDAALLTEDSGRYPLQRTRQKLFEQLQLAAGEHPLRGVLAALALGERQGIGREQWQLLRTTGTNHLVAISGLHIGIVAGFVYWLVLRLWRWPEDWPAPKAAAVASLLAAGAYATLAGFSVPTQRALIMVATVMVAIITQRQVRAPRVLALALLIVMVMDPLAVMEPGFWLSFGAVALIVYGMGARIGVAGRWWRWGRVQLLVTLGLAPLLVLWFQQVALVAPLANLLAVPWVSLLAVPLVLVATLLLPVWDGAGVALMTLALWSLDVLWWWLQWCASWVPSSWNNWGAVSWTLLPAAIGLVWLLAPRGWAARWLGAVWLLPMFLVRPMSPAPGEAWVTVLDVGQGLAVVVRTTEHAMLFDSGPSYGPESDAGDTVVVPVLLHFGIRQLDTVILSHGDSDHAGGAATVFSAFEVGQFLSGTRGTFPWGTPTPCQRGQQWQWNGVQFAVLSPPSVTSPAVNGNDSSCVLRISTQGGSLLLVGDIEAAAERELLRSVPEQLAADVLVAPHHGSKTSSTAPFVTAVAAHDVVFSVGYRNRFGFPHPTVVQRYRESGAVLHDTARAGALTVRLARHGVAVESWRPQARRYWSLRD